MRTSQNPQNANFVITEFSEVHSQLARMLRGIKIVSKKRHTHALKIHRPLLIWRALGERVTRIHTEASFLCGNILQGVSRGARILCMVHS